MKTKITGCLLFYTKFRASNKITVIRSGAFTTINCSLGLVYLRKYFDLWTNIYLILFVMNVLLTH